MKKHKPLLPHAVAKWLIENTALSFRQIGNFCGLHELTIAAIADGEIDNYTVGVDPIKSGQLTAEDIARCSANHNLDLTLVLRNYDYYDLKTKKSMITTQDKLNAICWVLHHYPCLDDQCIARILHSTKMTVSKIRTNTHKNTKILPRDLAVFILYNHDEWQKLVEQNSKR